MRIAFSIVGLDSYIRDWQELIDRVRKPRELAKTLARRMRACFAENFNAEGRPEKWAPLAESTIAAKQALYEAGAIRGRRRGIRVRLGSGGEQRGSLPGILMARGDLKDSVARAHTKGNIERIKDGGREIEVGSSLPYAAVHDQGGEGSYTIMPKAGKFLAFFGIDRRTGQPGWIFTRGPVRHPPMIRRSFLVITDDTWDLMGNDVLDFITPGVARSAASD